MKNNDPEHHDRGDHGDQALVDRRAPEARGLLGGGQGRPHEGEAPARPTGRRLAIAAKRVRLGASWWTPAGNCGRGGGRVSWHAAVGGAPVDSRSRTPAVPGPRGDSTRRAGRRRRRTACTRPGPRRGSCSCRSVPGPGRGRSTRPPLPIRPMPRPPPRTAAGADRRQAAPGRGVLRVGEADGLIGGRGQPLGEGLGGADERQRAEGQSDVADHLAHCLRFPF